MGIAAGVEARAHAPGAAGGTGEAAEAAARGGEDARVGSHDNGDGGVSAGAEHPSAEPPKRARRPAPVPAPPAAAGDGPDSDVDDDALAKV